MYAGKMVESAEVGELFSRPSHPYTVGLFNSLPKLGGELHPIPGVVPSLLNLPMGCAFRDRCSREEAGCAEAPPWTEIRPGHRVRCWRPAQ